MYTFALIPRGAKMGPVVELRALWLRDAMTEAEQYYRTADGKSDMDKGLLYRNHVLIGEFDGNMWS